MISFIFNKFKCIDANIKNIMINGFKFSFAFSIISCLILITYNIYMFPLLFECGTILFKTSIMFCVDFVIMALAFDKIKR